MEMSLEERALRHADAFFTDESRWLRGGNAQGDKLCVGMAMLRGAGAVGCKYWHGLSGELRPTCTPEQEQVAIRALNVGCRIIQWNDVGCPNFAAMQAHLRTRIEYYTKERLKDSYIVVIGPGRQVRP